MKIDNEKAFDDNKAREQQCLQWLTEQSKTVKSGINKTALIGIINGLLIIVQSALLAFIFQQIIIEGQQWKQLFSYLICLVFVFMLRGLCNYLFQVLGFHVAAKIKQSTRQKLLDKFSVLGSQYAKQYSSGELATTTLEHIEALESYYCRYLPQKIIVVVLPLLMIAIIFPINWVVALILLITGPLIPVFMMLVGMGAASASRQQFLVMGRMNGYFLDRLQGLATLKQFAYCQTELQNIKRVSDDFRQKTMDVLRIAFLSSAVLEFFSAIAVALVAVYVGLGLLGLIHFGPAVDIELQQALFVLLLAPEFFNPLKKLATYYHDKAEAVAAVDNVLQVLQQPVKEERSVLSNKAEFVIELDKVGKKYQHKDILKSFDLQVSRGEKVALTGESGVGKTTLINLLLGVEKPSEGAVLVKGKLASQSNTALNIAWAGQQSTVFYASIKDNISLLNPEITDQQIERAAQLAGVNEFADQLELGLLTRVGEKGYGLSGGQIQRIFLARAFVKNTDIILLDEPTAHLDEKNKHCLLEVINNIFKDKTLIIASHDPVVITSMDRVINLS